MTASEAIRTLLLRRGFSLSPLLLLLLLLLLLPSLLLVLTSSVISEGEGVLQVDDGPLSLLPRGEFDVSDVVYSCDDNIDNGGGDGRRRELPPEAAAEARRRG